MCRSMLKIYIAVLQSLTEAKIARNSGLHLCTSSIFLKYCEMQFLFHVCVKLLYWAFYIGVLIHVQILTYYIGLSTLEY